MSLICKTNKIWLATSLKKADLLKLTAQRSFSSKLCSRFLSLELSSLLDAPHGVSEAFFDYYCMPLPLQTTATTNSDIGKCATEWGKLRRSVASVWVISSFSGLTLIPWRGGWSTTTSRRSHFTQRIHRRLLQRQIRVVPWHPQKEDYDH